MSVWLIKLRGGCWVGAFRDKRFVIKINFHSDDTA